MTRIVAMLGRGLLDPDEPVIRADDAGLTRGDGCFEGCRVLVDADGTARVDKLDDHLVRMARSASALDIDFVDASWRELIDDAVRMVSTPGEYAMKLLLTRGAPTGDPTGLVTIGDLPPQYERQRRDGVRLITLSRGTTSDAFAGAAWLLGGVKTLSYAVNMAAHREAERRGCDDVIFTSADGVVLEAPTSTVVWTVGPAMRTASLDGTGILGSTTAHRLFGNAAAAGWHCESVIAHVDELHAADALWLVGSVRGPVDVIELDGHPRERRPDLVAEIRRLAGFDD